ncbi:hypothetical protein C3489_18820 [Streptomyces sp. Ru71]|uniref:hypothetical protein n=1 Tax=Streptomyces sp. Ru71 TaxID=2080746 RepID=UPI000CDE02D5|nr:hypothetical protein [Streptomyces sp. Ru71]POX52004.1 hypothetical protein C3489_18820 [Streptomyces sp. Ru71]
MATESNSSTVHRDEDPLITGLLARLAPQGRCDFLPDLPGRELLSLLSRYHRRPTRVGFPEPVAERN